MLASWTWKPILFTGQVHYDLPQICYHSCACMAKHWMHLGYVYSAYMFLTGNCLSKLNHVNHCGPLRVAEGTLDQSSQKLLHLWTAWFLQHQQYKQRLKLSRVLINAMASMELTWESREIGKNISSWRIFLTVSTGSRCIEQCKLILRDGLMHGVPIRIWNWLLTLKCTPNRLSAFALLTPKAAWFGPFGMST